MPANSIKNDAEGLPIFGIRSAGSLTVLPFLRIKLTERPRPFVRISRAFKYSFCPNTRFSRIVPSFSISLETAESCPAGTVGGLEPGGGGGPSTMTRHRSAASMFPADGEFASNRLEFGSDGMPVISGVPDGIPFEFPLDTTPGRTLALTVLFDPPFAFEDGSDDAPHAASKPLSMITLRYFINSFLKVLEKSRRPLTLNDSEFSHFPVR